MKRKSLEFTEPDNNMVKKLDELTIPKLCIRLNTLCVSVSFQAKTFDIYLWKLNNCIVFVDQYIQKQISATEDGIRKSLALVRSSLEKRSSKLIYLGLNVLLFFFDGCRVLKCQLACLVSETEIDEVDEENSMTHGEAVDELFATTYDSLRETNANCITKTRDLIGKLILDGHFIEIEDALAFSLCLQTYKASSAIVCLYRYTHE